VKPYRPQRLPLDGVIDWAAHVRAIGQANAALARYDGLLQSVVNPAAVLLSPLTIQEAVLSSRIEGTRASIVEVLEYEAEGQTAVTSAHEADIQEIINYRRAMQQAVAIMRQRPISLNLIKQLHATLLDSVRGRDKSPGLFRRTQNYIVPAGQPIERATFVPPTWDEVEPAMFNWESYLHADERDRLVQLAVAKAQFELIHPFLDGNGRIGRLLIPLFLFEKGLLSEPVFYLSAYLEAHRDTYYERLHAVSQQGDWNGWIAFCLTAVIEQARDNADKTRAILTLYDRMKQAVPTITRSQYAIQAIDALFDRPIFQSGDFITRSGIPRDSALRILRALRQHNLLADLRPPQGRRGAVMIFAELIRITAASG
jgi:Fic family protein